jgi:predicted nucleic acid-binding Zn ribbon protein
MPIYRYVCGKSREERCTLADLPEGYLEGDIKHSIDIDERLTEWNEDGTIDVEKSTIVQLVYHGMTEDKEVNCPSCGIKSVRIIGKVTSYFPGNCFLNKADCKRQMALHKLENDDPYGHMRPEGDKEALVKKLKRGSKAAAKNFYPGGKGGLKSPSQHQPGT